MEQLKKQIETLKEENKRLRTRLEYHENKQDSSEEFLNTLINCIPNPLFVKDEEFKHMLFNESYMNILKLSYDDIYNKTDFELFKEDQASKFRSEDIYVFNKKEKLLIEEDVEIDGELGTFLTSKVRISDSENKAFLLGLVTDISEKKKYQSLLESKNYELKQEKQKVETLLQEVNHRVKNNLQILNSMLSLQLDESINDQTREVIVDFKHRVIAIANIHELLYQADNLSQVPFDLYIERIVKNLARSCEYGHNIRLAFNLSKIIVNSKTAVPLGMVVNEIVMNSIKYGCSELGLEIYAEIAIEGKVCTLLIGDRSKLKRSKNKEFKSSTGSELIELFCNQVGAEVERFLDDDGVHYVIKFEIKSD